MSTRNFVPRSGSEGQIGTSAKPWGVVVADIGHFATVSGSISGSVTSTGSFGRLEIAGDSSLTGDVTIGGNINIGDADTDSLTIAADLTSNLVPNVDSTYDIGSSAKNWKVGHIEQISSTNNSLAKKTAEIVKIFPKKNTNRENKQTPNNLRLALFLANRNGSVLLLIFLIYYLILFYLFLLYFQLLQIIA